METKAILRGVRLSVDKGRLVADLVRGKDVQTADEILKFSERDAAIVIRKLLRSAVANAEHNDEQIADDLYVSACFADEGKTSGGRHPVSPWGKPEGRTRQQHKESDKLIIRRRRTRGGRR
jgi:large subunit ribosomal protein L22